MHVVPVAETLEEMVVCVCMLQDLRRGGGVCMHVAPVALTTSCIFDKFKTFGVLERGYACCTHQSI